MDTTMSFDSIKIRIRNLLVNDLDAQINASQLNDDISLYEDGVGLDSISIVNLIVLLEEKFGFTFGEDDLNYELFSSINHLATVISKKI